MVINKQVKGEVEKMNRYSDGFLIGAVEYMLCNGGYATAERKICIWQKKYNLNRKVVIHMWAMLMSNVAAGAGITLSLWACIKALQIAAKSNRYKSEREAVDSQEVWANAAELQEKIDTTTGRYK